MAAASTPTTPEGCLTPTLFDLGDHENWLTALATDGFVVLRDFLPPEEREAILDQFWSDLAEAAREQPMDGPFGTNFHREDRASWPSFADAKRSEKHAQLHFAQADFFWRLRGQPRIAEAFSRIHQVDPDELCVSLDSFSMHLQGHPAKGLPLHDDQCAGLDERSDMLSVQGAYNFFSVEADDTGFVAVPGSHQKWAKRRSGKDTVKHKRHFGPIPKTDKQYEWAKQHACKLLIPENCFVLWNSKTLHGTAPGSRERPAPPLAAGASPCPSPLGGGAADAGAALPVPNRLTCFVAMMPKALRSKEALASKRKLYEMGGSSDHWATHGQQHVINGNNALSGSVVERNGAIPSSRRRLL